MQSSYRQSSHRHKQSGFSLVELLVASLIGLIIIGSVGTVFLSTLQTSRTKSQLENSTEALRFAAFIISNQVRNASSINADSTASSIFLTLGPSTTALPTPDCFGNVASINRTVELRVVNTGGTAQLQCSVNGASPQTLVSGLNRIQFQYGCLVTNGTGTSATVTSIRETFANAVANPTTTGCPSLANPPNPTTGTVTRVYTTIGVTPTSDAQERVIEFSAATRSALLQNVTRVSSITPDSQVLLVLTAVDGSGNPILSGNNTGGENSCSPDGTTGTNRAAYKIWALDRQTLPPTPSAADYLSNQVSQVQGYLNLEYASTGANGAVDGVDFISQPFAPIGQIFSLTFIDDHILQPERQFTIRLAADAVFEELGRFQIDTSSSVTTTIRNGRGNEVAEAGEMGPDGLGPCDKLTLVLHRLESENGTDLGFSPELTALEGEQLWFVIRGREPVNSGGGLIADTVGTIPLTFDATQLSAPSSAIINQPFAVTINTNATSPEAPRTTALRFNEPAASDPLVSRYEWVAAATAGAGGSTSITIIDNPPAPIGSAGVGSVGSGTELATITWPSGHLPGQLGFLVVETTGDQRLDAAPADWIPLIPPTTDVATTAGSTLHIYYRFATSNVMPPAELRVTGGDHILGQIFTFNGIDPSNPIASGPEVRTTTTTSTDVINPSILVNATSNLIVLVASRPNDSGNLESFSTPTNANLVNITELAEAGSTVGTGGGFRLVTANRANTAPADIGLTTGTSVVSTTNVAVTWSLRPR